MKVLASTAMLGAQVAMPELAFAQAQCPPIGTPCVVGVPQGPAPCPVGAYCSSDPGGYGYTGGGGSGGSNSIPENEATAPQPAPPPPPAPTEERKQFCQAKKDADYKAAFSGLETDNAACKTRLDNESKSIIYSPFAQARYYSCRQDANKLYSSLTRLADLNYEGCLVPPK